MSREAQIDAWLSGVLGDGYLSREPASEDASFRRYLRVHTPQWDVVLMDAPPENEDCRPFVHVNGLLRGAGLPAPRLYAADVEQGFVLLEDLGDACLLEQCDGTLVDAALELLVRMQARVPCDGLAEYDPARLRAELALFTDWFLPKHLGVAPDPGERAVIAKAFDTLVDACIEQPRVFVHRDYHSRNLMVRPGPELAIIDHQDAVRGPLAYDVVSLLRDVYVRRDRDEVLARATRYAELGAAAGLGIPDDPDTLTRWMDLTGAQRHLKIAGIFSRLHYRDGKSRYLADIPLALDYLAEACAAQPELAALGDVLARLDVNGRIAGANQRVLEGGRT